MKKVSIIVPVYNVKNYIRKGAESLINQTLDQIEIILVDDGSTDGSGEECDRLSKKYTNVSVIHKENGGVSSARNCGLELASGEYVGFMDADDWVSPRFCEILYNSAKKSQADLAMCDLEKTNGMKEKPDIKDVSYKILSKDAAFDYIVDFKRNITGSCFNKLFKRSVIASKKFSFGIAISEDIDFLFHILWDCEKIVYVPYVLCYYLFRENSAVHSPYTSKMEEDLVKLGDGWINHPHIQENKRRMRKMSLYRLCICELAILNKRVASATDDTSTINVIRDNVKRYWMDAVKAQFGTVKKIQLLVFLVNFQLYKKIYSFFRLN